MYNIYEWTLQPGLFKSVAQSQDWRETSTSTREKLLQCSLYAQWLALCTFYIQNGPGS